MKYKNMLSVVLVIILAAGLTACGMANKKVFSANGETFTYKDVMAYGFIFAKENNIVDTEMLKEKYENNETYRNYYKRQLEEEILEMLLLYGEAQANDVQLTEDEKEEAEKNAKLLTDDVGEERLKEEKVSESDIKKLYEIQMLAESYIESFSKEGAASNDEGDVESEDRNDSEKEERYVKVFQVIFPTVLLDEDGMVQSDQDGNLKKLSEYEILKKKREALEFSEKAKSGASMEALLKDYDETVTGSEQYLKYNDLETTYKKAIDSLSEGEVSGSFEGDYGYYVIQLMESDAAEYAQTLFTHEKAVEEESRAEEEIERLYNTYIGKNSEYKNQELWDQIEIEQFMK